MQITSSRNQYTAFQGLPQDQLKFASLPLPQPPRTRALERLRPPEGIKERQARIVDHNCFVLERMYVGKFRQSLHEAIKATVANYFGGPAAVEAALAHCDKRISTRALAFFNIASDKFWNVPAADLDIGLQALGQATDQVIATAQTTFNELSLGRLAADTPLPKATAHALMHALVNDIARQEAASASSPRSALANRTRMMQDAHAAFARLLENHAERSLTPTVLKRLAEEVRHPGLQITGDHKGSTVRTFSSSGTDDHAAAATDQSAPAPVNSQASPSKVKPVGEPGILAALESDSDEEPRAVTFHSRKR